MKKKIITVMSVCALMSMAGCNGETMEIKNDKVIIEYGQTISADVSTYLNNDAEFCKDITISGLPENEKDKTYPATGKYEVTLHDKKNQIHVSVEIRDTVAPVLKDIKNTYETEYGKQIDKNQFKAEDLSEVSISLDDKDVNYKKAGEYKATVSAEDCHGNRTEKSVTIVVKEDEKKEDDKKTSSSNVESSVNSESTSKPSTNNKTQSTTSNKPNAGTSDKKPTGSTNTSSSSTNSNAQSSSSTSNKTETNTSNKKPTGSTSSSSSSTSINAQSSSKPAPHQHKGPAVENMYFDTCDELDAWAEEYLLHKLYDEGIDIGCAYGVSDCSCGKVYINMFY